MKKPLFIPIFMMILFLVLFYGFVYTQVFCYPFTVPMCLDTVPDISRKDHTEWVPCPLTKTDTSSFLRLPRTEQTTTKYTSAPFNISLTCLDTTPQVCQKAERAFQKAGEMISQIILFKEPVRVNATFMSFCTMLSECNQGIMTLGGSSPARAMPLLNQDGLFRLHPQALVKQFELTDHPAFAPFDILSIFNADAPFWFEVISYNL